MGVEVLRGSRQSNLITRVVRVKGTVEVLRGWRHCVASNKASGYEESSLS